MAVPTESPDSDEHEPEPEPEPEPEGKVRLTWREAKQESDALAKLAKTLVDMKPWQLAEVKLPEEVDTVVQAAASMRKGARVRELRRITQLLRRLDADELTAAVADAIGKQRGRAQREEVFTRWRERLVAGGDAALAEFVEQYPQAERQRLRQLLRQARRDPESAKAKQAMRAVLNVIRAAVEAKADPAPP